MVQSPEVVLRLVSAGERTAGLVNDSIQVLVCVPKLTGNGFHHFASTHRSTAPTLHSGNTKDLLDLLLLRSIATQGSRDSIFMWNYRDSYAPPLCFHHTIEQRDRTEEAVNPVMGSHYRADTNKEPLGFR